MPRRVTAVLPLEFRRTRCLRPDRRGGSQWALLLRSKRSLLLRPALLLDTRALLERLDLALGSGARPRLTHAKSLTATWKSQGSQISGRFLWETARKARRIDHISANLCLLLHEEGDMHCRGCGVAAGVIGGLALGAHYPRAAPWRLCRLRRLRCALPIPLPPRILGAPAFVRQPWQLRRVEPAALLLPLIFA
jgi:hypothetical protein